MKEIVAVCGTVAEVDDQAAVPAAPAVPHFDFKDWPACGREEYDKARGVASAGAPTAILDDLISDIS